MGGKFSLHHFVAITKTAHKIFHKRKWLFQICFDFISHWKMKRDTKWQHQCIDKNVIDWHLCHALATNWLWPINFDQCDRKTSLKIPSMNHDHFKCYTWHWSTLSNVHVLRSKLEYWLYQKCRWDSLLIDKFHYSFYFVHTLKNCWREKLFKRVIWLWIVF